MPSVTANANPGDQEIAGLLSDYRWSTSPFLYFSFPTLAGQFTGYPDDSEPDSGFAPLNAAQQGVVVSILQQVEDLTTLTIRNAADFGQPPEAAELRFGLTDETETAHAYVPSDHEAAGDVWFGNSSGNFDSPVRGNYAYTGFLHEIGHALGLKHPHETAIFGAMDAAHDNMNYTVMSYRSYAGMDVDAGYANEAFGYAQTFMMYDIAALQYMYGADFGTNGGDSVYTWDPLSGKMSINGVDELIPAANRIFMTLWDGGGVDTYDMSGYATNVTIDLNPGQWSKTSSAQRAYLGDGHFADGNIANALQYQNDIRSLIENATGGSGHDRLTGNQIDNILIGGAGSDILYGGGGDDRLEGGDDADQLFGEAGSDTIYGGAGDDFMFDDDEYGGAGNDQIFGGDGWDGISINRRGLSAPTHVLLDGGGGPDVIGFSGQTFQDDAILIGGDGDDSISAFRGHNVTIDAGAGDDRVALYFLGAVTTVTLGGGKDYLALRAYLGGAPAAGGSITVTDFEIGAAGDRLELLGYLVERLVNWDPAANPFATHLRLVQQGADTLVQIDIDGPGAAASFETLLGLQNVQITALGVYNLGGYAGDGSAPVPTTIVGTEGLDQLWGTGGDDLIQGLGSQDEIFGGGGDDRIEGGDGADLLYGQYGDDQLFGDAGIDNLNDEEGGDDRFFGGAETDYLVIARRDGTPLSDVLLDGGEGNDYLSFSALQRMDKATLVGGNGDDEIHAAGDGEIIIDAGGGADLVVINYSDGHFDLTLGAGADLVEVGADFGFGAGLSLVFNDFVAGNSAGADVVDLANYLGWRLQNWDGTANPFHAGYLRLVQSGADTLLTRDLDGAAGPGGAATLITFRNLSAGALTAFNFGGLAPISSDLSGTEGNDTLTGTADADVIHGLGGNDTISGIGGDDLLYGDEGDDYLDGGQGDDLLYGGAGNDTLFEGVFGGSDSFYGEDGNDVLLQSAYTAAAAGADILLDGGAGDDVIKQYSSVVNSVTLVGGAGHDRIETSGGGGQIAIDAGADADFVEISHYDDTSFQIALGSGADLLSILSNVFSPPGETAVTISDFAAGDGGDTLSLITYLVRQTGFRDFAGNPFATGHARLIQSGADAVVQIDADGAGAGSGFTDLVVLQNVAAASLTARNLGGYAANGAATPGVVINGSAITDMLGATSGDDQVYGFGGDDILFGGAGNDRIEGGAGHDRIEGDLGDDILYGGEGNDILRESLSGNNDQLFGEGGNDILVADRIWYDVGFTSVLLDGGEGFDDLSFQGRAGFDDATLVGGAGGDTIHAGLGRNVTIDAGAGDDAVTVNLGIANAVITLGAGADILFLSVSQAPVVVGFTVLDFEAGGAGDRIGLDSLTALLSGWDPATNPFAENYLRLAQQGADTLLLFDVSGEGAFFKIAGRLADLDAGELTAFNLGYPLGYAPGAIAIAGTDGADNLSGTANADELIGFAGGDFLNGLGGADRMIGGLGNDSYFVDNAGDAVIELAGEGFDIVYAGAGYILTAGSAVEVLATINEAATTAINLTGNALDNYVTGNAGANILDGGAGGLDALWGRAGDDSYFVDTGDDVIEYAGQGYDIVYARTSFVLSPGMEVEVLGTVNNLATTAINLTGNASDNYITGNAGNNVLNGGGGSDILWGREGDDGYFADGNDIVLEYAGQGYDIIYARADYTLVTGGFVEALGTVDNFATTTINLTGNELDNYITGNAGSNTIDGGTGSDTLWGRDGNDSYFAESNDVVIEYAGQGYDIIYARGNFTLGVGVAVEVIGTLNNFGTQDFALTGNELENYVSGNAGANTIDGGGGADNLQGREGADTFMFGTTLGGGNIDTILDFGNGPDRIALDDAVFAGLATGALAAGAFRTGAAAQDADDRILYDPTNGALYFDDDGNGGHAAVHFATLATAPGITAADFIVF